MDSLDSAPGGRARGGNIGKKRVGWIVAGRKSGVEGGVEGVGRGRRCPRQRCPRPRCPQVLLLP